MTFSCMSGSLDFEFPLGKRGWTFATCCSTTARGLQVRSDSLLSMCHVVSLFSLHPSVTKMWSTFSVQAPRCCFASARVNCVQIFSRRLFFAVARVWPQRKWSSKCYSSPLFATPARAERSARSCRNSRHRRLPLTVFGKCFVHMSTVKVYTKRAAYVMTMRYVKVDVREWYVSWNQKVGKCRCFFLCTLRKINTPEIVCVLSPNFSSIAFRENSCSQKRLAER